MEIQDNIRIEKANCLTAAVFAELTKHYKGLGADVSGNEEIALNLRQLSPTNRHNLITDINFKLKNPKLPLENLCNRLDNYAPKNESQTAMSYAAKKLVELEIAGQAAGLFMYGKPGVGKTHIAVGVTKELMKRGQEIFYLNVSNAGYKMYPLPLGSDQAWVVDDINSPHGIGMDMFKKIVLNAHDNGGRVFATSNTAYEKLMKDGFVGDSEQKPRFLDRIGEMFHVLQIKGESFRQSRRWFEEAISVDELKAELDRAVQSEEYERAAALRDQIRIMQKQEA